MSFFKSLLFFLWATLCFQLQGQDQIGINRVNQMPDYPQTYKMRDWKQVAIDYDSLVFSQQWTGEFLPVTSLSTDGFNYPEIGTIRMDSYVGSSSHGQYGEAINIIPAIVGATLVGVDKTNHYAINWVEKVKNFYNLTNQENVYLNNPSASSGNDWWYETMPNVFFYQLYSQYPDIPDFEEQLIKVADQWLDAVYAMGGSTTPWKEPEMNYRAWNLKTMTALEEGVKEPEAAGAIAWILHQAYHETGDRKYLAGAQMAIDFLDSLESNPSYELQLPYGVLTAARMNAELGADYDVEKMINWCFSRGELRGWGSIVGAWNGQDVSGLIGEANDQGNDYAFLLNGFQQVAALVPLVKYDKRFSVSIGKWVLNMASASRLFYRPYLDAAHQSDAAWSMAQDENGVIAYEALKETWTGTALFARGDAKDAGWAETNLGIYGSSHVGYIGAIIQTTDVEGILQLDANATDFFGQSPFPTYLLYNPFDSDKMVTINAGPGVKDIYDAISETLIQSGISDDAMVSVPAKGTLLISYIPTGSLLEMVNGKLMVEKEVLDYFPGYDFTGRLRIKSLSPVENLGEVGMENIIYCTASYADPTGYQWYLDGVLQDSQTDSFGWVPKVTGNHVVRVVVNNETASVTDSIQVEVVELIPRDPVISFISADQKWYEPGTEMALTTEATDPRGLTLSYVWTFEQGTVLVQTNETSRFLLPDTPGVYEVMLTVSNSYDSTATKSFPVLVTECKDPEPVPLIYLPLDDHTIDFSGNGYTVTTNKTSFVSDSRGIPMKALKINGSGDAMKITNDPTLNFSGAVTVSFWLYASDFQVERFVVSHGSWEQRWKVSVTSDRKLRWTVNTSSGTKDLDSSFPIEANSWYHFTLVYSGYSMELYVDGLLDSFFKHSGGINSSNVGITIGKQVPGVSNTILREPLMK